MLCCKQDHSGAAILLRTVKRVLVLRERGVQAIRGGGRLECA